MAGSFLFSGHLDPSTKGVSLVKQYIGAHQVEYTGRLGQDGDGMLFIKGRWSIKDEGSDEFRLYQTKR